MTDYREHLKAFAQTGFWGKAGAGCVILAKDTGRLLIAYRGEHVEQPLTWGTWGGAIDGGERPVEAVRREVSEETGYRGSIEAIKPLLVFAAGAFRYHNFLVVVPQEFRPRLGWEHAGFAWCDFGNWPSPLHFGLRAMLDDAESVRTIKAELLLVPRCVDGCFQQRDAAKR